MSDAAARGRALALSALMVLSVVAVSVAFTTPVAAASGSVTVGSGTATPSNVSAGSTVSSQQVYVTVDNVSADGNTDRFYVEFPNELSSGLSPNSANVKSPDGNASIGQSVSLVDGFDGDGVKDTLTFTTKSDGGGAITENVSADASVSYPSNESSYDVDFRVEDSTNGSVNASNVATIQAFAPPTVSDYNVSNPSGRQVNASFNSSEQLTKITVDVTNGTGGNVASLTEADFTETNNSGTYNYVASTTPSQDGQYTATLNEAVDDDSNDGANGQSGSVYLDTVSPAIQGGSTDPTLVDPGSTVNNQQVTVTLSGVSADGNSDTHYVEFPNALSSGLSVNSASVNGSASIAQTAQVVDGYDNDGTDETIKFQTDVDGGGTVPLNVTVDASVNYPDTASKYYIDAKTVDSDGGVANQTDVTFINASSTPAPVISSYAASGNADQTVDVSFDSSEQLANITVTVDNGTDTVATLTESDFTETSDGTWHYAGTASVPRDDQYTATLTEANDTDGNDGSSGQSETVVVDATPGRIAGGSASPAQVSPGSTESNQKVNLLLSDVSADGNTDTVYVEFPNALATSGLSVNSVSFNSSSVTSSARLVEGYDNDGVDDTVRFATSPDAGGDVDLNATVDVSVSYPNTETTYPVDAKFVDSKTGPVTQRGFTSIQTGTPSSGGSTGGSTGGGGGGGGGGLVGGTQQSAAPSILGFDVSANSQDVDVSLTVSRPLDELTVDVSGATQESLSLSDFSRSQQSGTYVYTVDVAEGETGTFEGELVAAANSGGSADVGQTDSVTVEPLDVAGARAVAAPPWVGDSQSVHTVSVPVTSDAGVAGETLQRVTVGYSSAFVDAGGSVSSVSDDQNVVALQVVSADGDVKSSMGGTDAVSVNVDSGAVHLDLSDVDSSRKPTLAAGDRVVVRLRPVTNPGTAGDYQTDVTLATAAGHTAQSSPTVHVKEQTAAGAVGSAFVTPGDSTATVSLDRSEAVQSVTVDSAASTSGSVQVTVPAERPDVASSAPGIVVTTLKIDRPASIEDSQATVAVDVAADSFDGDASDLTIAHYDASSGSWQSLDTSVVGQSGGTVTLEATAPGTSPFAITAPSGNANQQQQTTANPGTETSGNTPTPTATATETPTPSQPGFGIVVSLLALIGAALLARLRREN